MPFDDPNDVEQIALSCLFAAKAQLRGRRVPGARQKIDEAIAAIWAARPDLEKAWRDVLRWRRKMDRESKKKLQTNKC